MVGVPNEPVSSYSWFVSFINSTFLFPTTMTMGLIFLTVLARWVTKADHEKLEVADFAFGVDFLIGAAVSVPSAVAFRVAKSLASGPRTSSHYYTAPSTTITFGTLLLLGIVVLMFWFARIEGRRRGTRTLLSDLGLRHFITDVVVPDLAGIGAVAVVLLYGSLGGPLRL